MLRVYTIGFVGSSAAVFFGRLRNAGVQRVIDVRLNNLSQLSGYTKREDLSYFLRTILRADYVHETRLAPRDEHLVAYRNKKMSWEEYESEYLALITERRVEATIDPALFSFKPAALLCSETKADKCHRRLAAEYLAEKWGNMEIVHL